MSIIIDIILVAIIAVSAFFAARKGLIGTLFSLLGAVIAIALSLVLCTPVSSFINDNYVNPSVKKYIVNTIDSTAKDMKYEDAMSNLDITSKIKEMPEPLKKVLELAGISADDIIKSADNVTESTIQAKDNLVNRIASPISGTISRVIALIALFILLNIGLMVIAKLLTVVFDALPIGKTLNRFGGLIFGILRGLIIVFVISVMFVAVSKSVNPNSKSVFSEKTIESTVILKSLSEINPIGLIMNIK